MARSKQVHVTLSPELHQLIVEAAQKERRPVANFVRWVLEDKVRPE